MDHGAGGTTASSATTGSGGVTPSGGSAVGGSQTGGVQGTGGSTSNGGVGGGGFCTNATPCGGDVLGTWTVTASCLTVSGQVALSSLGLNCQSAPVTGSLQVTGTWTAKSDGSYSDNTVTTGVEQLALPASCLEISGTTTTCDRIGGVLTGLGFASSSCTNAASGGGCTCLGTVDQTGWAGVVTLDALTSGKYTASGNVVTLVSEAKYSYCASGNTMTWTPQGLDGTTVLTGTVVFQKSGSTGSGGAPGTGGATGSGGATFDPTKLPCDIYAAAGFPCVAAHSSVRLLASAYAGPLYQVRIGGSKGTTTDIGAIAGGWADSAAQDVACGTDVCTISKIYDQSGRGNHLTVAPAGGAKSTPDNEADAKALLVTIGGHKVYGVHFVAGVGYRNNTPNGTATGDNPETEYMITSGDVYNAGCCFDYGNMETNSRDNGEGAAEAIYFGNCTIWGKGAGSGPWVMGDLENGLWAGNVTPNEANGSVSYKYVTAMVKGDAAGKNHWAIKAGNAQSGSLLTMFDGARPSTRYNPMRKEGAIGLGTAGDNSNAAQGNFFEGVMTATFSSDAADEKVQASIVSVYGQ